MSKNREKKPSEFDQWKDYIKEKAKKYYWRDKMVAATGDFPKICPNAIPKKMSELYEDGHPDTYGVYKINGKLFGECQCALYEDNKDQGCECWFNLPPSLGRCDCFIVYWRCSLFRKWLKIKEISVVVK